MGIGDYDVWLRQPLFYRDDMLLIAEAQADAERIGKAKQAVKDKARGRRR